MSNDRHEYDTGAVRSADCDNVRYDLISPIGLRALARTYAEGAEKFGAGNWENGMPVTDMLNHAIAHIYNFLGGDRKEDHLAHAAWNLLGAIHSMELWPHLNKDALRTENCGAPPCVIASQVTAASGHAEPAITPPPQQVVPTPSTFEALKALVAASNR